MRRSSARRASARAACVAAIGAVVLTSPRARADSATEAARYVYARGAAEYDHGDFAAAAVDLADADALVPNDVTLATALGAAAKADLVALGMELVERAKRSPNDAALAQAAAQAKDKLAGHAAQIVVRCAKPCRVTIDRAGGKPGGPGARWVAAGDHTVAIEEDGVAQQRAVTARAGETVDVDDEAKPPPPVAAPVVIAPVPVVVPLEPPRPRGISPIWFVVGAGATAVAGGLTIAFGVDTASKHAAFERAPSTQAADAGQSAELRTNVMIGVTAVLAAATTTAGVFAVRWSSRSAPRQASIGLARSGVAAAMRF